MTRRILAAALAATMAIGVSPALAQQANGLISGRADDSARQPYSDYNVQLRDATTGQIIATVPLDAQGRFSAPNLSLSPRYFVELLNVKDKNVVCTEGPFVLTPAASSKTDVNIDCGKVPALVWILGAGAGTAAAIALATQSASQ